MRSKSTELGVEIRQHNVIYMMMDDIKEEICLRMPLLDVEDVVGKALTLKEFTINVKSKKVPGIKLAVPNLTNDS